MRRPFHLIPDSLSSDTVTCLEQLLDRARKGEVIGLAFAAMLRRRDYIVNSAGEVHRNPTFGLGMVHMLNSELARRVRAQTGQPE
jgi:hypothetical protein